MSDRERNGEVFKTEIALPVSKEVSQEYLETESQSQTAGSSLPVSVYSLISRWKEVRCA